MIHFWFIQTNVKKWPRIQFYNHIMHLYGKLSFIILTYSIRLFIVDSVVGFFVQPNCMYGTACRIWIFKIKLLTVVLWEDKLTIQTYRFIVFAQFVWGIYQDPWIPRTKGQLREKCFHLMTSSWLRKTPMKGKRWTWFGVSLPGNCWIMAYGSCGADDRMAKTSRFSCSIRKTEAK